MTDERRLHWRESDIAARRGVDRLRARRTGGSLLAASKRAAQAPGRLRALTLTARDGGSRAALLAVIALLVAGCGAVARGGNRAAGPSSRNAASSPHRGSVAVLYAGSLVNLMETKVGPAFERATGYGFEGFPGGSEGLAEQIKGKVRQGDVLISASPTADRRLQGRRNGEWVSSYLTFASSPLLIAYNPKSGFASQLRRRPWWRVIAEPGFRLGRTDPQLDPKGRLTVNALRQASREHHDPAVARLARDAADVFPEEALLGRLQAGQLDAGFFYSVEAAAVSPTLPTISIAPIRLSASYTVTILRGSPNPEGAVSFIRYLLGGEKLSALQAAGLDVGRPALHGNGEPASLRKALASR